MQSERHTNSSRAHKTLSKDMFIAQNTTTLVLNSVQEPLKSPVILTTNLLPCPANLQCASSKKYWLDCQLTLTNKRVNEESIILPDFDSFCSSHKLRCTCNQREKVQMILHYQHLHGIPWKPALDSYFFSSSYYAFRVTIKRGPENEIHVE